jgi:hypothetical protein
MEGNARFFAFRPRAISGLPSPPPLRPPHIIPKKCHRRRCEGRLGHVAPCWGPPRRVLAAEVPKTTDLTTDFWHVWPWEGRGESANIPTDAKNGFCGVFVGLG